MDPDRRTRLLTDLQGDAARRAAALSALRLLDLGRRDVLLAALRCCDDDRPLPDGVGASGPSDPFAAFFGDAPATRTIGEHAADRLAHAGVPGMTEVAEVLAASLAEPGARPRRAAAVARLLAEAPWDDRAEAVRTVAPALIRADAPLYAVVATADPPATEALIALATDRFHERLANELLNHPPARDATLAALADVAHQLDDPDDVLRIVALLYQWASPRAPEVALRVERAHRWAACFAALDEPAAAERLVAWCADPGAWPADLGRLVELVLRQRDPVDGYPLAAVLDRLDGSCAPLEGRAAVARSDDLLRRWLARGLAGDRPDRGWQAARLLAEAELLGDVGGLVVDAIGRGEVPLDAQLLRALADAGPPGIDRALGQLAARHPEALGAIVPALLRAAGDRVLGDTVERLLAVAEAAPFEERPARRGLVRRQRRGVDVEALRPAVDRLGEPAITQRFEALLPVVGPRG